MTPSSYRNKRAYKILKAVFLAYIVLMSWEVFLGPYRSFSGVRRYNLYPFKTIIEFFEYSDKYSFFVIFINLGANIITFIPLGFFIQFFSDKFRKFVFAFIFYISIIAAAETMQLVLNVGVFDIDDIILNTLGCIFGYFIYKLTAKKSSNIM